MDRLHKKTKSEMLQELVEEYRNEHGVDSVDLREVASWLLRTGRWQPSHRSATKIVAAEVAQALREEYFTDPQGRRIRKKHAVREWEDTGEGKRRPRVFWHDITTAKRPHMQAAFQQRRQGIVMDCRQLKQDVDSYNSNYNRSVPIQLVFNFEEDLEELGQEDKA